MSLSDIDIVCIAVLNLTTCVQKKRFLFSFSAVRIPSDLSLKYNVYKQQISVFTEVFFK